ncbi:ARPP-1 family domain-containing protein [Rhodopirellula sp. SWK7]|uniref:ARPP-1 family domain-containing protein n=1 Tax=Rhodopirellula sp. SWK7 TaxID=595460 RepID=UPI0002BDCF37|nr:DUF6569 family protein [Rhodopirellula sp. SWK7]EMI47292.1 hypothetical protein RRSWK_00298 [Rhodopirellula sp. SWK7]
MVFRKRKKNARSQIELREVLRGCEAGRLQSVGYMQVIPLVLGDENVDLSDDRFVSPMQCDAAVYTTSYGTLGFRNSSASTMIIPCHAGYVVKQHAQDHAMAHAGVVAATGDRRYDTAMCIQAAQGGLIAKGAYRMLILPHALRENAIEKRATKDFRKLWDDISTFNESMGVAGKGHLEYFLKAFKKELDEFVAEFESVPNQIGAIILIDDRVVGVERAPSFAYWQSIWPSLIRECYGSLAIEAAKAGGDRSPDRSPRVQLPLQIESLDELESLIAEIARQEDERARSTVRVLLDEPLTLVREEEVADKKARVDVTIETTESEHFTGQVIRDGETIVYASLPATQLFVKSQKWSRAEPFAI